MNALHKTCFNQRNFITDRLENRNTWIASQFYCEKWKQVIVKVHVVKVSHSLIAVGAVGVRIPLYLGHS